MTADKMFSDLGYFYEDYDHYVSYTKLFKEWHGVRYEIAFLLEDKEVEITPTYYGERIYFVNLDKPTLDAINQKIKELGW